MGHGPRCLYSLWRFRRNSISTFNRSDHDHTYVERSFMIAATFHLFFYLQRTLHVFLSCKPFAFLVVYPQHSTSYGSCTRYAGCEDLNEMEVLVDAHPPSCWAGWDLKIVIWSYAWAGLYYFLTASTKANRMQKGKHDLYNLALYCKFSFLFLLLLVHIK